MVIILIALFLIIGVVVIIALAPNTTLLNKLGEKQGAKSDAKKTDDDRDV
jgi:hypothetical protein